MGNYNSYKKNKRKNNFSRNLILFLTVLSTINLYIVGFDLARFFKYTFIELSLFIALIVIAFYNSYKNSQKYKKQKVTQEDTFYEDSFQYSHENTEDSNYESFSNEYINYTQVPEQANYNISENNYAQAEPDYLYAENESTDYEYSKKSSRHSQLVWNIEEISPSANNSNKKAAELAHPKTSNSQKNTSTQVINKFTKNEDLKNNGKFQGTRPYRSPFEPINKNNHKHKPHSPFANSSNIIENLDIQDNVPAKALITVNASPVSASVSPPQASTTVSPSLSPLSNITPASLSPITQVSCITPPVIPTTSGNISQVILKTDANVPLNNEGVDTSNNENISLNDHNSFEEEEFQSPTRCKVIELPFVRRDNKKNNSSIEIEDALSTEDDFEDFEYDIMNDDEYLDDEDESVNENIHDEVEQACDDIEKDDEDFDGGEDHDDENFNGDDCDSENYNGNDCDDENSDSENCDGNDDNALDTDFDSCNTQTFSNDSLDNYENDTDFEDCDNKTCCTEKSIKAESTNYSKLHLPFLEEKGISPVVTTSSPNTIATCPNPNIIFPNSLVKKAEVEKNNENLIIFPSTSSTKPIPNYKLPQIDILHEFSLNTPQLLMVSDDEVQLNAHKLVETLQSFGVGTRIVNISKGPSVTRYELTPDKGVKVSKIVNLSDDIALNLAAASVRIEAPIPGKAAIGIEIPNREVTAVYLRELLECKEFVNHPSKLSFAVGKDTTGNVIVADIAKMPHLLIAGATGSGKSVCINTLIASILYKATPSEVKLIMIDPKVVELSIYNGIPHLLVPVVTDPKKAAGALYWAIAEMNDRYKLFADNGVRDLANYNNLVKERNLGNTLPQIVIIIDELADLMMVAPKDVEDYICRLAQMARAAGMHLVIATQRPSVDVITGIIKANIPSRISFAVSSQVDSRTILDMAGAEKLLGRGDMLFNPLGLPKPLRVQGTFISDKEVEAIVNTIKSGSVAQYDEEVLNKIENQAESSQSDNPEDDELLYQAIETVLDFGQASTSFIQRKLKVGYSRAARLMDQMESWGIVSCADGSKPRRIMVSKDEWHELRS